MPFFIYCWTSSRPEKSDASLLAFYYFPVPCYHKKSLRRGKNFYLLFGCPTINFGLLLRDCVAHLIVINVIVKFGPEDHREPRKKFAALSNFYHNFLTHYSTLGQWFPLMLKSQFIIVNVKVHDYLEILKDKTKQETKVDHNPGHNILEFCCVLL